jgi:Toprim domain/YspA, cpYpsA-related SLOG family
MGHLLGNAVCFDVAHGVMVAGEGIETVLSLRCVIPTMPMVAALSAAHLAAILFPATLRRLYIARDDDPAGDSAMASLLLPAGPKIAFTGGFDFNDHRLICGKLDKVHAKHPDMVLLHGGSPKARSSENNGVFCRGDRR